MECAYDFASLNGVGFTAQRETQAERESRGFRLRYNSTAE
jgi:hypothetical protein